MKGKALGPWKVLESKTVFSSLPHIEVHSQKIELPDGRTVEPYFRIDLRAWVVMAAITQDGRIVVARQYRHGIEGVSLMLPGGLLEKGEDPLTAAKRELLEETGFASDKWDLLGRFVGNSNYRCGETSLYLARGARKIAEPDHGDLEETEVHLVPLSEIADALRNGAVISLSSAAAISLALSRITDDLPPS
jgi:ADP-ribose pyrophosphatase